jgi:predicted RND superfamily exporter protein
MGLAGWSGILLTNATGIAPVIIFTLAVADSIHILSTMFYEMRFGKRVIVHPFSKSQGVISLYFILERNLN